MRTIPGVLFMLIATAPAQDTSVFTMRALATEQGRGGRDGFDLETEVERLQEWLTRPGVKERLQAEPLQIHLYNWLRTEQGGSLNPGLAWFPREISAHRSDPDHWDYSLSIWPADDHAVPLFSRQQYDDGPQVPGAPKTLLELVPIDMLEPHFDQNDIELDSLQVTKD